MGTSREDLDRSKTGAAQAATRSWLVLDAKWVIRAICQHFSVCFAGPPRETAWRVEGVAMSPTLNNQDRLIVDKSVYRRRAPGRGDVVMLYYPLNPSRTFVKRVYRKGRVPRWPLAAAGTVR